MINFITAYPEIILQIMGGAATLICIVVGVLLRSFSNRLGEAERDILALKSSGHDVDIKLAEIQKDLKYLVVMVESRKER